MDLKNLNKTSLWTVIASFLTAFIGSLVPVNFIQYVAIVSLYFVFLPSLGVLIYSTIRTRREARSDFSVTLGKNRNPQLFKHQEAKTEE
jgi:hypothetical protein